MFKPDLNSRDLRETKNKEEKHPQSADRKEEVKLSFKMRFDYKGSPRPARLFFGGKKTEEVAEEVREKQITLWRNMPLQGIEVISIDAGETYILHDEKKGEDLAFAPLEIHLQADSLEDIIRFIMKEEFRRIEILQPLDIKLTNKEAERLLFKVNDLLQEKLSLLLKEGSR